MLADPSSYRSQCGVVALANGSEPVQFPDCLEAFLETLNVPEAHPGGHPWLDTATPTAENPSSPRVRLPASQPDIPNRIGYQMNRISLVGIAFLEIIKQYGTYLFPVWLIIQLPYLLTLCPTYSRLLNNQRRVLLLPPRFNSLWRGTLVLVLFFWAILLDWVRIFVRQRLLPYKASRVMRTPADCLSAHRGSRAVHTYARLAAVDKRFRSRLRTYDEDLGHGMDLRLSQWRQSVRERRTFAIVAPHVPVTVLGIAMRAGSGDGPVVVGIEPLLVGPLPVRRYASVGGGRKSRSPRCSPFMWLAKQCLAHELTHVLQDLHEDIFRKEWDRNVHFRGWVSWEFDAHFVGSRELFFIAALMGTIIFVLPIVYAVLSWLRV